VSDEIEKEFLGVLYEISTELTKLRMLLDARLVK
jgi:hypothetical protein